MTTLTGTLSVNGVAVTGSLWLEISQQAAGSGGVTLSPSAPYVFALTGGAISGPGAGPYTVLGNDVLSPANTWYVATVFGSSGEQLTRAPVQITGASVDIGAFAAALAQGWLAPPSFTVNAHASTHATAGADPVSPSSIGAIGGTGTATKLMLWTASTTAGDSVVTQSGGLIGINEASPAARLHIAAEGAGETTAFFDSYGGGAQFVCRAAGGTKASPSAIASGGFLGGMGGRGYGATGWGAAARAAVHLRAAETFTDSAQGAYVAFYTTAIGSTSATERFQITHDGRLRFSASTVDILAGSGSPEGVVTAVVGSLYVRTDGGAGTTLYVKQSGTGNTGWAAK